MSDDLRGSRTAPPAPSTPRDALLEARFLALWKRNLRTGAESDANAVWQTLAGHYSESHRFYHDQGHLAHCLEQLDLAGERIPHPDRIEMAIWFHDVVNEPGLRTNEALSADLFRDVAGDAMDAAFVASVEGLILATTHRERPADPDQQFICDIDLSSFGCPWDCFMRDSAAVKAEFPGPDEEYYRGKKVFLMELLARPRIFLTDFFHQRYEDQARANIGQLLRLIDTGRA